jgi:NTE family protein
MKNIGLVLGGGGVVGIAWELGVACGLKRHAGFDPAGMSAIVGTSAGSAVGAQLALGLDLEDVVSRQQRPPGSRAVRPSDAPSRSESGPGSSVVPEEIMRIFGERDGDPRERAKRLGKLAMEARPVLTEDAFIASFGRMFGTDSWPEADLRVTTVECETGDTVLWTKAHGVGLQRAVASSCAVPGFFPAISINGKHYTDGPRIPFVRSLVEEKGLEALLFIGPQSMLPEGVRADPELDALEAGGMPMVRITGGAALAAAATDLMDPDARMGAVAAGLDDGRDAAAQVEALLRG